MATRTVESGNGPVPARVCTSEDVVAFFSSTMDVRCTVARLSDTARGGASTVHTALNQCRAIVVEDHPPRSIQPTRDSEASSTPVEAAHGNGKRGATPSSGLETRSLEEALAEGMQANVILAQPDNQGRHSGEKWLFMAVGRQCSDVGHNLCPVP